jgi:hypothetical protein
VYEQARQEAEGRAAGGHGGGGRAGVRCSVMLAGLKGPKYRLSSAFGGGGVPGTGEDMPGSITAR